MSHVDFYVLAENSKKETFACALVQKVWRKGNHVFINTASAVAAKAFDDMLWSFNDISFVPHALVTEDASEPEPILIGYGQQTDDYLGTHTPIVLNLDDQIPPVFNKIPRILEIVGDDKAEQQKARKRYRDYQNQGHVLNKHEIGIHYG